MAKTPESLIQENKKKKKSSKDYWQQVAEEMAKQKAAGETETGRLEKAELFSELARHLGKAAAGASGVTGVRTEPFDWEKAHRLALEKAKFKRKDIEDLQRRAEMSERKEEKEAAKKEEKEFRQRLAKEKAATEAAQEKAKTSTRKEEKAVEFAREKELIKLRASLKKDPKTKPEDTKQRSALNKALDFMNQADMADDEDEKLKLAKKARGALIAGGYDADKIENVFVKVNKDVPWWDVWTEEKEPRSPQDIRQMLQGFKENAEQPARSAAIPAVEVPTAETPATEDARVLDRATVQDYAKAQNRSYEEAKAFLESQGYTIGK